MQQGGKRSLNGSSTPVEANSDMISHLRDSVVELFHRLAITTFSQFASMKLSCTVSKLLRLVGYHQKVCEDLRLVA